MNQKRALCRGFSEQLYLFVRLHHWLTIFVLFIRLHYFLVRVANICWFSAFYYFNPPIPKQVSWSSSVQHPLLVHKHWSPPPILQSSFVVFLTWNFQHSSNYNGKKGRKACIDYIGKSVWPYRVIIFFLDFGLGLVVAVKRNLCASQDIFGWFSASNVVGTVLSQHDFAPVHKTWSMKAWLDEFGVEELNWPPQSPDLNPVKHLLDELQWRMGVFNVTMPKFFP